MTKLLVVIPLLCAGAAAHADDELPIDGKDNLICAVTQWQECVADDGCLAVSAAEIDGADLIAVDFEEETVTALDPGNTESTAIRDIIGTDVQLVVQGLDNALAWTMTVDKSNGRMAMSGARGDLVFVAFGRCAEQ